MDNLKKRLKQGTAASFEATGSMDFDSGAIQRTRVAENSPVQVPQHFHTAEPTMRTARMRAEHAAQMFALNPKGFRTPSRKSKNWRDVSFVEGRFIEAGLGEKPKPYASEARKRRRARIGMRMLEVQKLKEYQIKAKQDSDLVRDKLLAKAKAKA